MAWKWVHFQQTFNFFLGWTIPLIIFIITGNCGDSEYNDTVSTENQHSPLHYTCKKQFLGIILKHLTRLSNFDFEYNKQ